MNFVFYDTETTGTNVQFDQILQFGAILTDGQLREIDRFEINSRLLPDVVPSPGAMLVTGVTADQLTDSSLPSHFEMIRAIEAKLSEWSPAVFIGHNSLGFDEHLLRQALYKTLHSPYLTNTNGNGRADSLKMLRAIALLDPNTLQIPTNDRGNQVFKLDKLAPLNGFAHENAHEAMADVEATIHMCKILANRAPNYWRQFTSLATKAGALDFARNEPVFCLTDHYYGKSYSWPVTSLGTNPENGSEVLAFDLTVDPTELRILSDEQLIERLGSRPKPLRSLRVNAAPILSSLDKIPNELTDAWPQSAVLNERAKHLIDDRGLRKRLIEAFVATREPFPPGQFVEQQIYDGFPTRSDSDLMAQFQKADWPERISAIDKFQDTRLRTLGGRLAYAEAPDLLNFSMRQDIEKQIASKLVSEDKDIPWTTLSEALTEADKLLAEVQSARREFLTSHVELLKQRLAWAQRILR